MQQGIPDVEHAAPKLMQLAHAPDLQSEDEEQLWQRSPWPPHSLPDWLEYERQRSRESQQPVQLLGPQRIFSQRPSDVS